MVRIFALLLTLTLACQVQAQEDSAAEKSRIEIWLEEVLSSAGREVTISGFAGAFSSEARFDEMTIADDDGIWLTIENAKLVWSRSALLSGRVDINEIAADKVSVLRRPKPAPAISTDDAQSWTFEVPELPVSLEIDKLDVAAISLDESLLGQAVDLSLTGKAQLVGGQLAVNLEALRGEDAGRFAVVADFSNETRVLDVDLSLQEPVGGIVASLLNIPNSPALDLTLVGAAPLSDFTAQLNLKTNQISRLSGDFRYSETVADPDIVLVFGADLAGDLRPLFTPDFHPFFGESAALDFAAKRFTNGALGVEQLHLATGVLNLTGDLTLGADQLPEKFNLSGSIAADAPVRLPSTGLPVTLGGMSLQASFDAAESESWTADVSLIELKHEAVTVPAANLTGSGTIERSFGKRVTGDVQFVTGALAFADQKLASVFDGGQTGRVAFDWADGRALSFSTVEWQSTAAKIVGAGRLGGFAEGLPLAGQLSAEVQALQRFSGLAARPLQGAAKLEVDGRFDLLGGGFDGVVTAQTQDLNVDEPRLDPLLEGEASIALSAARTPEGTALRGLNLRSNASRILASGQVNPEQGVLDIEAQLTEVALVEPKLTGESRVSTRIHWAEQAGYRLEGLDATLAGSHVTGDVSLNPETQTYAGQIHLISPDLSRFAMISGRDLSGRIDLSLDGAVDLRSRTYQLAAQIEGDGLQTGISQLDPLLAGALTGEISARADKNTLSIGNLQVTTPLLDVTAGNEGEPDHLAYRLLVKNVAPIAPGFSGAFDVTGTARLTDPAGQDIELQAKATGPAGLTMQAKGRVFELGKTVDLAITGAAPLGLTNSFIAPNSIQGGLRYDVTLRGAPSLSALQGQLVVSDGRMALPDSGLTLENIEGSIGLADAQAQIDISGTSTAGGTMRADGSLSLAACNAANLTIALNGFGVSDPELFATSLTGQVSVVSALAGSASVSGELNLGKTEVIVPSGGGGRASELLDIRHINAPGTVYATLDRAGVGTNGSGGSGRALALNLSLNAPNQIFVRGRGLDAELGGRLQLGGTTAEVAPSGSFELMRGRFDILGQRFVMNEGLINLRGSLDPFLRFVAETATDSGVVRVILEGLASNPELRFEADPDLPQEEAIVQLLFGRSLENISALQAASLVSAIATLSGRSSGGVTGRLRTALGLSDFDVTTTETGARQLRAGTYINENIYSEIVVDSEGNQAIELNLDITPNVRAKGSTNSDGNTGIGIFFEKDY